MKDKTVTDRHAAFRLCEARLPVKKKVVVAF
jgi:hypothetical protein